MSKSRMNFVLVITLLFVGAVQSFGQTVLPATKEQTNRRLIAVLKSDAPHKEKADACRQLSIIGTKDAIAPLAALLYDEKLSHMARYGLEPMLDPTVDEALRTALGKLKGRPLIGVIGSIGVRRDAKAVRTLAKMLRDHDLEVAQAAARALGKIGNSAAATALQGALANAPAANQPALCEGLFRCAEALAADNQRDEAIAIYDQLRSLQAPCHVCSAALRAAILTRQKEGLGLLRQYLRSDDYILFSTAVKAAQELRGTEVTQALTAVLNQLPPDNQILVIQTVGKRADAAASAALFALSKSGAKTVRLAAIRALAELGLASAVPVLAELLEDADREISLTARESFAALPGREADAAVMAMLNSGKTSQQLIAIDLIGRRRMTTCIPALLKAASHTDQMVRPEALKQLGKLGSSAELPALLDLLMRLEGPQDLDAAERALITVCAKADDPQSHTERLTRLLAKAQPAQKRVLLRVLSVIGGRKALKAVSTALNDPNAKVRATAIRALGEWKTSDAAPFLLKLAQTTNDPNDKILCLRCYLGLTAQPDLTTDQRLSACWQAARLIERSEEKKQLLGVLSDINSPDALAQIIPYLDDPATQEEAGMAYVAISEKLLKEDDTSKLAPKLIKPLETVARVTANADLARRAKALLQQAETGFVTIFNGKDLTGWDGDKEFWLVQNEAITGQSTTDNELKNNTFLIWQDDKIDNFELRLSFRIENGNSGIQFRSQRLPNWVVVGYQADFDSEVTWTGGFYDEGGGRSVLCKRGQKVVIDEKGKREVTAFAPSEELLKHIKPGDWNNYYIIARDSEITLKVNGLVTSQLVDREKGKAARSGIIALQLHAGEPMKVQFKDIRLKKLSAKACPAAGPCGVE